MSCPAWQVQAIDLLQAIPNLGEILVYNPRRADFPMGDPNAAEQQIVWEFTMLDRVHVFSMWFCNAPSDQPICMYELGRHVALREDRNQEHLVAVGVEPGYRREADVRLQMRLALGGEDRLPIAASLEEHARNIGLCVLAARDLARNLRERVRLAQEARMAAKKKEGAEGEVKS